MTCFNRKEKTEKCIKSLEKKNSGINFSFVVVDDNSKDGTFDMLKELSNSYDIHILRGNGKLYYSAGMRTGMEYIKNSTIIDYDYLLMVNDDVAFYEGCVELLLQQSIEKGNSVIVGATCDKSGNLSYGAIKYIGKGLRYRTLSILESNISCDTFNANCVLIPKRWFINSDIIDSHYRHSLGDFDYGLSLRKCGCNLYTSNFYVGMCNNNSSEKTWGNSNLSIKERLKLKESVKGAPFRPWFYFLKKNFGIVYALIYSFTPYIRICLKR